MGYFLASLCVHLISVCGRPGFCRLGDPSRPHPSMWTPVVGAAQPLWPRVGWEPRSSPAFPGCRPVLPSRQAPESLVVTETVNKHSPRPVLLPTGEETERRGLGLGGWSPGCRRLRSHKVMSHEEAWLPYPPPLPPSPRQGRARQEGPTHAYPRSECHREVREESPLGVLGTRCTYESTQRSRRRASQQDWGSNPGPTPRAWNVKVTASGMGKSQDSEMLGPQCCGGSLGKVVSLGAPKTAGTGDRAGARKSGFLRLLGSCPSPTPIAQEFPEVTVSMAGETPGTKTRHWRQEGEVTRPRRYGKPRASTGGPGLSAAPGLLCHLVGTYTEGPLADRRAWVCLEGRPASPLIVLPCWPHPPVTEEQRHPCPRTSMR